MPPSETGANPAVVPLFDVAPLPDKARFVVVGAGTVRRDDPSLTVRDYHPELPRGATADPRRVVLGSVPADAASSRST